MLATIFAYFGITDFAEAGRMTLYEYRIRKRAWKMQQLEHERNIYLQAYINRVAKAVDKSGKKYIFPEFYDLYDEDKRKREVLGKSFQKPVDSNLIAIAKRMQKYKEEGGN